jgi:hypothetical protein
VRAFAADLQLAHSRPQGFEHALRTTKHASCSSTDQGGGKRQ